MFRCMDITKDVLNIDSKVTIPHEVLVRSGSPLYAGVYGTNAAGDLVIPTRWATVGIVYSGADPSGDPSTERSPDVWEQLQDQINELKQQGADADAIKQAVEAYMAANPPAESDPTVPEWAKQPQKPKYTASEVGALASDELQNAVNVALTHAKESGAFDGPQGPAGPQGEAGPAGADGKDGQPGADGKDYVLTETDKTEIAEQAAGLVEVPKPGCIEVTGASVGQTIVVKAVDDNGKPTEWEAVNLPISGGSEEWDILANFTANEDVVSFATTEPPEGHTFDEYAEIVAFLFVTPNAGGFKSKIKFSLFDATAWEGTFNFSGLTGITDSAVSGRIGMMHIKKLPYGWMPICNYISYNEGTLNNILTPIKGGTVNESVMLTYPPNSVPENMTAILPNKPVTVIAIGGYQAVIGAGSKAIVYGKRCS